MNETLQLENICTSNLTRRAGLDTGPVPAEPYRSREYFEYEREQIFKRAWLALGRVERLPEPGSFFTTTIEIWNAPIVVTRDRDNRIQAFYNVCPHRGNQVVLSGSGNAFRFACNYHNWTFRNSGELLGVPDQGNFFDLDKKACGLVPISTEVWEGWIFINHQKTPEVSLETFLGEFGKRFSGVKWVNAEKSILLEAHLNANWKVLADAFSETYHIPSIHPATIGTTFANAINPHSRPLDARFWGSHRQFSTFGNPAYSPPEDAKVEKMVYAGVETGNVLAAAEMQAVTEYLAHPAINEKRSDYWALDIAVAFPGLHINLSPGGFWSHRFWPISVNRTRWEAEFHVAEARTPRERLQQELFVARLGEILLEDVTNTERTQIGIESRAYDTMQLQDGEVQIRHNLHTVDKWVRAVTVKEAIA
jgi:phenylpropionate dioxygenase-like ring-hydroxylating dioxygenase large terminal subunit